MYTEEVIKSTLMIHGRSVFDHFITYYIKIYQIFEKLLDVNRERCYLHRRRNNYNKKKFFMLPHHLPIFEIQR